MPLLKPNEPFGDFLVNLPSPQKNTKLSFLALDGGGVRGVHTCEVLEFLESKHPGFIKSFDAIAGTSTGSIIACGLAFGLSPRDIKNLYFEIAPQIFSRKWYSVKLLDQLWGAPYDLNNAKAAFKKIFGNATLSDLNTRVLVTSWNLDAMPTSKSMPRKCGMKRYFRKSSGKFWNNLHSTEKGGSAKIYHVLLSSIAAPTYFKPYKNHYMDGGMIQNSPGLPLVFQALCSEGEFQANLEDISLLSLGTSGMPVYFDRKVKRNWGLQNWIRAISRALTDANMDFSEYGLQSLLGSRYYRFAPYVGVDVKLNEFDRMQELSEATKSFLGDFSEHFPEVSTNMDIWLDANVKKAPRL